MASLTRTLFYKPFCCFPNILSFYLEHLTHQLSQELLEARKLSSLLEDKVHTLQQEAERYVPATKVAEVHIIPTTLCQLAVALKLHTLSLTVLC
jgi:hypothetical protein